MAACTAQADRIAAAGTDRPGAVPTPSIRTWGIAGGQLDGRPVETLSAAAAVGQPWRIRPGRSSNVYSAAPTVCPEPLMPKTTLSPDLIRLAADVIAQGHEMCCAGGVAPLRQVVDGVARVGGPCSKHPVHRDDRVIER